MSHGSEWLADLPGLCRRLCVEWSVQLGPAFPDCHVSYVAATAREGRPLVLKVPMPAAIELGTLAAGARALEADALQEWAGSGVVQLLEHDPATGAMLVERCVPGTPLHQITDPAETDRLAVDLLNRLHRPAPSRFHRLADCAAELAGTLPARFDEAGTPFDRWLLDIAIDLLRQLSGTGPAEVLLHGDFHHENILSAEREPWLAIDPLPMAGEPAYDAVQHMLFRKGDLVDPEAEWDSVIARFCGLLGVDSERVKAWTFARLVTDSLSACLEGADLDELEAWQGDLWSARLVHRLRA